MAPCLLKIVNFYYLFGEVRQMSLCIILLLKLFILIFFTVRTFFLLTNYNFLFFIFTVIDVCFCRSIIAFLSLFWDIFHEIVFSIDFPACLFVLWKVIVLFLSCVWLFLNFYLLESQFHILLGVITLLGWAARPTTRTTDSWSLFRHA